MIAVIRDDEHRIQAVCEWLTFDDKEIFIGEFEINPEHRGKSIFKELIRKIYEANPLFEKVCWFRKNKYPDREIREYSRDQILKHIGG